VRTKSADKQRDRTDRRTHSSASVDVGLLKVVKDGITTVGMYIVSVGSIWNIDVEITALSKIAL